MRIAIYGAGLVGSYLYRLLSRFKTYQVTIFEKEKPYRTNCGINSCAWATSIGFKELISKVDLRPEEYILQSFDRMLMNQMDIRASIMAIDKPKLITNLLSGADIKVDQIKEDHFDRIIDATGVARAYLPKIDNDIIASCLQYKVHSRNSLRCGIDISNLGYVWCFPLSKNEYHIGAGSIKITPEKMLSKSGLSEKFDHLCSCTGQIRFTSPQYSLPFTTISKSTNFPTIWGVGEAIGCVAPLAGEGILPGLKSANLLLSNWDDPDAYRRSIFKEFAWMRKERSILDKIIMSRKINIFDAYTLSNSTRRLGMRLGFNQSLHILKSLSKYD